MDQTRSSSMRHQQHQSSLSNAKYLRYVRAKLSKTRLLSLSGSSGRYEVKRREEEEDLACSSFAGRQLASTSGQRDENSELTREMDRLELLESELSSAMAELKGPSQVSQFVSVTKKSGSSSFFQGFRQTLKRRGSKQVSSQVNSQQQTIAIETQSDTQAQTQQEGSGSNRKVRQRLMQSLNLSSISASQLTTASDTPSPASSTSSASRLQSSAFFADTQDSDPEAKGRDKASPMRIEPHQESSSQASMSTTGESSGASWRL